MALNFTYHQPGYFPGFFRLLLSPTVQTTYIETTIYPTFYKQMVIEFKIPPHWGLCLFDIYRAESDVGPWRKVNPAPVTGNYYKDTTTLDFSKLMQGWYMVECILPDGRPIQGQPTTWGNKRRRWVEIRANEIERRATILLEKFVGVQSMIFRRRQFGMRCPECWDFQTEKTTKDKCKTCLGTSFRGGYYPGFSTLLQYDPTPNDFAMEPQGTIENNSIPAWTISYPRVEVQDVVLRVPDWKMFRVEHTMSTELQTTGVRQIMNLVELPKYDIEFELAKQAMPVDYTT